MPTTSTAFFEAIADAGVTHCFVNLGSDHPGLMDAMVRGRHDARFPRIVTCPSEVGAQVSESRMCLHET